MLLPLGRCLTALCSTNASLRTADLHLALLSFCFVCYQLLVPPLTPFFLANISIRYRRIQRHTHTRKYRRRHQHTHHYQRCQLAAILQEDHRHFTRLRLSRSDDSALLRTEQGLHTQRVLRQRTRPGKPTESVQHQQPGKHQNDYSNDEQ